LQPLTDDALKEVFKHISLLYNSAYGTLIIKENLIDLIFRVVTILSGRTRMFVKGSVEALDLNRLSCIWERINEVLQ